MVAQTELTGDTGGNHAALTDSIITSADGSLVMSNLVAGGVEKRDGGEANCGNKDEDDYDLHFGDIDENEPLFGNEIKLDRNSNEFAAY